MGPITARLRPAGRPGVRLWALPLILAALVFQLGAPGAAARMAAASLDPFSTVVICSPDKGKSRDQGPAHHPSDHDCQLCAACAPLHATAAEADPPRAPFAAVLVLRPIRPAITSPRGPPRRTAQARAPPLSA